MPIAGLKLPTGSEFVGNFSMAIYTKELRHYVYIYLRKSDLTPYYVGKGIGHRSTQKHKVKVPTDKDRIIYVATELTDIGAIAIERRLIKWYGRKDVGTGILRNLTDGGEGSCGRIVSTKNNYRLNQHGEKNYMYGRCGELHPRFNATHTQEARQKISEKHHNVAGSKNPNAKRIVIVTPIVAVECFGNFQQTCFQLGISYATANKALKTGQIIQKGKSKGLKIYYLEP